jgi:hypothetical protein
MLLFFNKKTPESVISSRTGVNVNEFLYHLTAKKFTTFTFLTVNLFTTLSGNV